MMKVSKRKPILPKIVIEDEPWITKYWRPMMAWQYFLVCLCDFIIFPSLSMYYASKLGVSENWKWDPITLTAGGFYHMAMGVIIGVTAWTRGQENMLRTEMFGRFENAVKAKPYPRTTSQLECEDVVLDEGLDPPAHPTHHQGG